MIIQCPVKDAVVPQVRLMVPVALLGFYLRLQILRREYCKARGTGGRSEHIGHR